MEKKNVVFLTVLAVATLLTAVVGTTFAYFTATVQGNGSATTTTITTANNLGITYSDGEAIQGNSIIPGWVSSTKHISVTNNGTVPVKYQIAWADVVNTFSKGANTTDDLVYSVVETSASNAVLTSGATTGVTAATFTKVAGKAYSLSVGKVTVGTGTDEIAVAAVPANGATTAMLIPERTIAANETQEFDVTVYFVETGIEQNENMSSTGTCANATGNTAAVCTENGGTWTPNVKFSAKFAASIVSTDGIHSN